jgi:carboxylesterase
MDDKIQMDDKLKMGCLIIHGFAGNPDEVSSMSDYFERKGYYVSCPVLKGHCGKRRDLAWTHYNEWIKSAEDELVVMLQKFDSVIIIGFSMGGLIAANLAIKYKIKAMITLNTPIYYWEKRKIFKNILYDIRTRKFEKTRGYINSSFSIPFTALYNFTALLKSTKLIFNKIKCPIFIGQGLLDETVQHRSADFIYENAGSVIKVIKRYENASHLICHSPNKDELFEDIYGFVNELR